jgi:hypothetical protein
MGCQERPNRGHSESARRRIACRIFKGVSELLPIYEPLEDGAEIMWADHGLVQLGKLRKRAKSLEQIKEPFHHDDE